MSIIALQYCGSFCYTANLVSYTHGHPRWLNGKESACQTGDWGCIPGLGQSPRERNGKPLQYSCLGNTVDKGAWQAAIQEVTKELDTTQQLNNSNNIHTHTHTHIYIYMYMYVYVYPLFLGFTSYLGHHRTLSRVPCAIKKLLYIYLCVHAC